MQQVNFHNMMEPLTDSTVREGEERNTTPTLKRQVTKDLKEVKKVLDSTPELVPKFLGPRQDSAASVDSGFSSEKHSRKSSNMAEDPLATGNPSQPKSPMEDLPEEDHVECPVKITVEADSYSPKAIVRKTSSPDSGLHHLSASLPRKNSDSSTSSSLSDEYLTPPTSPLHSTPSVPKKSPSSPSLTRKEFKYKLKIDLSDLKRALMDAQGSTTFLLEHIIQVKVLVKPNTDITQRKRTQSSPCLTPTSPSLSNKKLSQSFDEDSPPLSPDTSPQMPHRNKSKLIEEILRKNIGDFVKNTDLGSLYPHLIAAKLISGKDLEEIEAKSIPSRAKNMFFYMILLDRKGPDAHKRLFDCLKKEDEHLGHKDLVVIIHRELRDHMMKK